MPPQSTARVTRGLSGWIGSALPDVVDPPDEPRGRRDRVVDAVMYLVAFAISTATLLDTWELHPPWLRPVAVVAVIATVITVYLLAGKPMCVPAEQHFYTEIG